MIIRKDIDITAALTQEQKEMLRAAATLPVVQDEDCPEFTAEELAEFKRVSETRKEERWKQNITLRLSPNSIKKARSLGKGYTSVLSRILEGVLNDPEAIKQYL